MARKPVGKPAALVAVLIVGFLAAPSGAGQAPNTLSPDEIAEGWILLFDGQTLFGWKPASDANWHVAEGALTADSGQPGLLCTTSQFGNYLLRVDFRAPPQAQSGVFLRIRPPPEPEDVRLNCYEVNIAQQADDPFPTGSLVGRKRAKPAKPRGDWQSLQIAADGGHFLVQLDGKTLLEYTDPKPVPRGHIGLEFRTGKIEFRNVKLKPLGMTSLFNGRDLSGWTVHPENKSRWTVTPEGWLHVQGGKGQLETQRQWADFTLQLEVYVNGERLNSGVFFRSIPGQVWNGYESQIHNGYKDQDRTKPADCGTGGIFRRQNARQVVANDREWFSKTIHADGNHMAVWVNGYQVSDWTDHRPPADNPRQGLRLKAGTIILQGHDPATDLFFRNLRIAELPSGP
ncbi:MAG: 3-keto-disaccharide hydrolase [Thermoguttaceae bacterium]